MWRRQGQKIGLIGLLASFCGLKSAHLYDESQLKAYMRKNLHEKQSKIRENSKNWLQKSPPKFPFVLALSSSDTPSIVSKWYVYQALMGISYIHTA
jgi:hypothetical protein